MPASLVCGYSSRVASGTRYAPETDFQIGQIEMAANRGTYLDNSFRRYAEGKDLSKLTLERFYLGRVVVRVIDRSQLAIDRIEPPVT